MQLRGSWEVHTVVTLEMRPRVMSLEISPHQYYPITIGYTINVLVHSFHKHFLSTYCVPSILLGYIMKHLWSLFSKHLQSREKLRQ